MQVLINNTNGRPSFELIVPILQCLYPQQKLICYHYGHSVRGPGEAPIPISSAANSVASLQTLPTPQPHMLQVVAGSNYETAAAPPWRDLSFTVSFTQFLKCFP